MPASLLGFALLIPGGGCSGDTDAAIESFCSQQGSGLDPSPSDDFGFEVSVDSKLLLLRTVGPSLLMETTITWRWGGADGECRGSCPIEHSSDIWEVRWDRPRPGLLRMETPGPNARDWSCVADSLMLSCDVVPSEGAPHTVTLSAEMTSMDGYSGPCLLQWGRSE